MIKAVATHQGRPLLVLGLSRRNTQRLHQGMPILVQAAQLGLPDIAVALCAGPSEEQLAAQLQRELPDLELHQDSPEGNVKELVAAATAALDHMPPGEARTALARAAERLQ